MASCETTRFLASLLNPTIDRMAILSTMPIYADMSNPRVVSPLSETTAHNVKSKVDTIFSSLEKPKPEALSTVINLAKDVLAQGSFRNPFDERRQSTLGHIFVLSPKLNGISTQLLQDETIQTHLICPGSVPWKVLEKVECNGWKLQPYYTDELQFLTYKQKDSDVNSLFNRLRGLISRVRRGKCCGKITDLVLNINAGPECSIESVIGREEIPFLQPGEVNTALIRLRIGAPPVRGYSLSPSQGSQQRRPSSLDLTDEIDGLLGTSAITVLTATLKYRHSFLPIGTTCTATAETRLKREDPRSARSRLRQSSPKVKSLKVAGSQMTMQKRLIFYLATHHSPRHALSIITQDFGEAGCRSACPGYIKLVNEELKYQARIIDRFDLVSTGPSFLSNGLQSPFEHFGHGLFDISNCNPQDWLAKFPDDKSSRTSTERYSQRQGSIDRRSSRQSDDTSRKASVDTTSPRRISGGKQYVWAKPEGNKENWIREETLRNQGCMGRDVLRSLSGRGRLSSACATRA